ncbi:transposase [Streptosporangium canum]|uniref:transposase n=1 Tax=Streptosporangium canum TaxID=324952 RepID=UPI00343D95E4
MGIDRGVVKVVTRSDGCFHHQVFARDREAEHARKLQRDFARTRKGSARRGKAAGRVADLVRRIRGRRQDFAAKTACVLATSFELVVFEALATRGAMCARRWTGSLARAKRSSGAPRTDIPSTLM